ncbi:MAG: hypothetical protein K2Y39_10645 [Candidatus Obscuribacterales bacterium]|nr:hypothetical protein [Candidatus Obscuribacterales bacterium]
MNKKLLSLAALALLAIPQASAIPIIKGDEASYRVRELSTGINWHTSLPMALQESARSGKLVVWIHMLGKIDGAT